MKKIKTGGFSRRLAIGVAGARGGLGLLSSKASGLLLPKDQQDAHNDAALKREAERFVEQLGELKGAYVKIGQMLALYGEHLLPSAVTEALHTLEAQTTALDWSAIEASVNESLAERGTELKLEQTAFGSASLAQVHKANVAGSNQELCVKIQYPGIANAIDDDFRNVMQMLSLARWIKTGRQLDTLTKELKQHLLREVDYSYELKTAEKVAELLKNDSRFIVPNYYQSFSSDTVLTMDFVDGFEVTHSKVQALSQERRNRLCLAMLELFFKEAFEWNLMQTDPNFGNYRIVIDETGENDQIALLDFGAVHQLPSKFTQALKNTILAAHAGDAALTIQGAIELNCLRQSDSKKVKQSFADFCMFILEPFTEDLSSLPDFVKAGDNLYDWHASRLLKRAGQVGSQGMLVKGFVVPPSEFMLMVRKLTGVFTFVSTLGGKINSASLLNEYR